ncbi:hypothetical protein HPP92_019171 [Vanilla planifolia]|uniref:Uncharacterized protein n=1 Tax=Vanilla planifolia TaxID=51239 RepID=A0A835UQ31_VANPL|nr:hypothetical protein HPP92_019171 [Vanilla planifolia]
MALEVVNKLVTKDLSRALQDVSIRLSIEFSKDELYRRQQQEQKEEEALVEKVVAKSWSKTGDPLLLR